MPGPDGSYAISFDSLSADNRVQWCDHLLRVAALKHKVDDVHLPAHKKVLLFAMLSGLHLVGLAGSGASNLAFRGIYTKEGNAHAPYGKELILKVARRSSTLKQLAEDANFRAVNFMDVSEHALRGTVYSNSVVKAVPIFEGPSGPCAAGFVSLKNGRCARVITFHCCEAMCSDLFVSDSHKKTEAEFREQGLISDARDRFERGMLEMLHALHQRQLFVMDLSLGNIAVGSDGRPCAIDLGSSLVLHEIAKETPALHAARVPLFDGRDEHDGLVLCTSRAVRQAVSRRGVGQHRNGLGTKTCRCEDMAGELKASVKTEPLTAAFAAAFDTSSAAMIIVQGYVPVERRDVSCWNIKLQKALVSPDAMYDLLCSGLRPGVKLQQTDALRCRAAMLHCLLAGPWRERPAVDEVLARFWQQKQFAREMPTSAQQTPPKLLTTAAEAEAEVAAAQVDPTRAPLPPSPPPHTHTPSPAWPLSISICCLRCVAQPVSS